jgi:organic hydroperoxide reductase OsmC/OhrA
MAVVTSRQAGPRPETIRTRLARFMPKAVATGWSIVWSSQTERPDEISDEHELQAAEHLGCYGAAVSHALAQAEVAAVRLRVTAEAVEANDEGTPQPITLEIRAQIPGPPLDQTIFEAIARRAEPNCPVWRSLAAEVGVRVIAIVDEPTQAEATQTQADSTAAGTATTTMPMRQPTAQAALTRPMQARQFSMPALSLPSLAMPRWLTPRMAILLAVALGTVITGPLRAMIVG